MFYNSKRQRVTQPVGQFSMTKQSHKDECDINKILSQYKKTGIITHITNNQPLYTDLPSDIDYQTSLNTLIKAEDTFASLPSKVRDHFGNDPGRFLAAFHDPSQKAFLTEYGFLKKPAPDPMPAAPGKASEPAPIPAPSGANKS